MHQPKASPLFRAVQQGDVAKLREWLADGEPVDGLASVPPPKHVESPTLPCLGGGTATT